MDNDWDINPDSYVKDSEGNFVLKLDGTPKKKGGRPKGSTGRGYNYHSKTKAQMKTKRKIRVKEKQIEKASRKLQATKRSLQSIKNTAEKLENEGVPKIITDEELSSNPQSLQDEAKDSIIFAPNEGPQTEF